MLKADLIVDVVIEAPPQKAKMKFPNGLKITGGEELKASQVKDMPKVKWRTEPDTYYTLTMVDPDAPSYEDPYESEYLHWLVVNIPGRCVCKGETLAEYLGAIPDFSSGFHRYVILIYKQEDEMQFNEKYIPKLREEGRPKFSNKKFAKKYNLGNPIAGCVFKAEYDEDVNEFYKQIIK